MLLFSLLSKMIRFIVLSLVVPICAVGQIRLTKLEVVANGVYTISDTDIIVVDTLILNDSSVIQLNLDSKDNYIHAGHFVAGRGSRINGQGRSGAPGKNGASGFTIDGPCLDGTAGQGGTGGTHGASGVNLFLYATTMSVEGSVVVDLRGGDGGDGGRGGNGGGGSPGTRVCLGGNGAAGGNGSSGGNGGNGGTLTIACKNCPDLRIWYGEKLLVRNYAGFGGLGGEGGFGGLAGLGVAGDTSKDGKIGPRGKRGPDGVSGKQGAVNFEKN